MKNMNKISLHESNQYVLKSKSPRADLKRKILKIKTPQTLTLPKMLTQDEVIVDFIKKIKTEKKTIQLSFRNQDWKKVKVERKNVNKLLPNIPMGNITELNELIHAGVKSNCDKIGVPLENPNKKRKTLKER